MSQTDIIRLYGDRIDKLRGIIGDLRNQLTLVQEKLEKWQLDAYGLKTEKTKLQAENATLKAENAKLKAENAKLRPKITGQMGSYQYIRYI